MFNQFYNQYILAENCPCPKSKCVGHGKCEECTHITQKKANVHTAKDPELHCLGL